MATNFFKYHALGNDYLVIDPNKIQIKLTADVIKLICHRNFGIGSDGILYGPVVERSNSRKVLGSDWRDSNDLRPTDWRSQLW